MSALTGIRVIELADSVAGSTAESCYPTSAPR